MKVTVVEPHGFCAGVTAALKKAAALSSLKPPLYCLHEIVHNELVVDGLKERGFVFVESVEEVPAGATVLFSAHGVSPAVRARAAARGLKVVDATCPFVARVHSAARAFAARGLPVVVIGNPAHAEVRGIVGEVDGAVVVDPSGARPADGLPPAFGLVSQTTMNADEVASLVASLRARHEVETMVEVCNATKVRQDAVKAFPGDALLVLGSANSSNTKRLCEVARCRTFRAGTMDDVKALDLAGVEELGVTSGASTPESFFREAVAWLTRAASVFALSATLCAAPEPPGGGATRLDDGLVRRYGAWVEKGPRVVSDTGEPLAAATVMAAATRFSRTDVAFPVDADGRIAFGCYRDGAGQIRVSCPGYYSRDVMLTSDRTEDIVLRRKRRPHPMLRHSLDVELPITATNEAIRVDLVDGDFLAPYGYGRHADAELRFGKILDLVGTLRTSCFDPPPREDAGTLTLLDAADGIGPVGRGTAGSHPDEFALPYEADDAACTNRSVAIDRHTPITPFYFRVRGRYGYVKVSPWICKVDKCIGGLSEVVDEATGKTVIKVEPQGREYLSVKLSWVINVEPGDIGLEPDDAASAPSAPPPVRRPAPADTNLLAFGVSPDGRSAVCFGRVSPSVRVPDIFPRAVYTAEPAKDLPLLDTLYVDSPSGEIPPRAFAGHGALRTVAVVACSLRRVREAAFAGCANLNALVLLGSAERFPLAEDAFAGCAEDFTPVFVGSSWAFSSCANRFPHQVSIPCDFGATRDFGPVVDLAAGTVEIPRLRFDGARIVRETSDGKVFSLDRDGRETKRRMQGEPR